MADVSETLLPGVGVRHEFVTASGERVAVLTHLRSDMKVVPTIEAKPRAVCPQGQPLRWLGCDARNQEQWFGVVEEDALCPCCWQQSDCFSLRLTWCWGLLADAVCLLRARTLRTLRPSDHPLVELLPEQLTMEWDEAV